MVSAEILSEVQTAGLSIRIEKVSADMIFPSSLNSNRKPRLNNCFSLPQETCETCTYLCCEGERSSYNKHGELSIIYCLHKAKLGFISSAGIQLVPPD